VTDGSWSADVLVIFGITGDLAHRMTIPVLYELEAQGRLDCPIVGVAARPMSTSALIGLARKAVESSGSQLVESVFARFAARLSYIRGDVGDATLYDALAEHLTDFRRPLYYLEVPPRICSSRSPSTSAPPGCCGDRNWRWRNRSGTTWRRRVR
jgi:glucose-6-phosphate 1-dehydrogenase